MGIYENDTNFSFNPFEENASVLWQDMFYIEVVVLEVLEVLCHPYLLLVLVVLALRLRSVLLEEQLHFHRYQ